MIWKSEYATGIHNIDDQHRTIVELITLFENMAETNAPWNELVALILRTRKFIEFHFSVEESLMQILPYPETAAHRDEHQRALRRIAEIEDGLLDENMQNELAGLMRDCLFDHILAGDKWLGQYALSLYTPPPSPAVRNHSAGREGPN